MVLGSASWYSTRRTGCGSCRTWGQKTTRSETTMDVPRSRTSAASVLCAAAVYSAAASFAFVSVAVKAQASATVTRVSLDGTWALRQSGG